MERLLPPEKTCKCDTDLAASDSHAEGYGKAISPLTERVIYLLNVIPFDVSLSAAAFSFFVF